MGGGDREHVRVWREKGQSEVGRKKRKVERSITKMWNKKEKPIRDVEFVHR